MGEHKFWWPSQQPVHPIFSLSPPSLPRGRAGDFMGVPRFWMACAAWSECLMTSVWVCRGKGRIHRYTCFLPLSVSESISSGFTQSCCSFHAHFSSLCAFSVSVACCWETEFNQCTANKLCLLLSIGSGDTGTGHQTRRDISTPCHVFTDSSNFLQLGSCSRYLTRGSR